MNQATYLSNHFLIAMPQLDDPNFHHTTTYICEHNEEGAMGLVINRPLELNILDVLEQMEIEVKDHDLGNIPVFHGGPVQEERGFVLHRPAMLWESTVVITEQLAITTSKDILVEIANGNGPAQYLITLGYAGWGAGQLEHELAENAWLTGPADLSVLFDEPVENRWARAAEIIGVDLNLLSGDTGHG
jgi:putative transcriptional regulator